MKIKLYLFCLLTTFQLMSQNTPIDSLKQIIKNANTQEKKVETIYNLGDYWFQQNYDSATFYYQKAYKISQSINYKKGKFDFASKLGNVYVFQGKYKDLILLMKQFIKQANLYNDLHYEAMFTANLGNAYMYNSEYENALNYFQKAVVLFNKNNEPNYERKINIFISICFLNSNNLDKSIEYSKLALKQSEIAKDNADICESLEYTGNAYIEKNEFTIAKTYLERQLKIAKELNLPDKIANSQYLLSRVYHSEKNFKNAIQFGNNALIFYNNTGNIFYKINTLTYLSIYNKDIGNYNEAISLLNEAESLATQNNMKSHLLLVYTNMALLNNATKNYEKAYLYLEKHNYLNDSLNSIELKNKLQELDTKFNSEKKELKIQNLKQQNAINTLQSKRRFWLLIALCCIILCLLVFTYLQFKNYTNKKELFEIKQKNAIVEERLRIAGDMHDDVGSGLSRIRYIISALNSDNTSLKLGVEKANNIIDESIQKMKEIVWSLNESNQNLEELIYYIRSQMSELTENADFKFISYLPEEIPNVYFGWASNRNTYLLVKESVNNAIKHSNATEITLEFDITNELIIIISDNGVGFDTTKPSIGNGLNNYKKRILELNGRFNLNSKLNNGTSITFYIPINHQK